MSRLACIIAGIACAGLGCDPTTSNSSVPKPTTDPLGAARITITAHPPTSDDPRDPQPQLGAMVHLDVYVIDLPVGAVSASAEFWKRIDEQAIGVAAADRVNRNGIRCGIAPRSESLFFSQFFDRIPHHAVKMTVDQLHADLLKLDVDKKFDEQDLFVFNGDNQLEGRSYQSGTDGVTLAYGPTPRDPGAARLVFCPEIRSEKKHQQFTALNDEFETTTNEVDRLYDASVTADVPDDSFFIMSPSSGGLHPTTVGGTFLIKSEGAERLEQVIVVIPTFVRLDGKPITLPDLVVKTTPTTMPLQNPAR